jgi:hypothetical protein
MPQSTQSIRAIFEAALLAKAAYADLTNAVRDQTALRNALNTKGQGQLPTPLLDYLIAHFTVVDHQPNTDNGYSGTLFASISSQPNTDFYFAQRGTETGSVLNLAEDLIYADALAERKPSDRSSERCWTKSCTSEWRRPRPPLDPRKV